MHRSLRRFSRILICAICVVVFSYLVLYMDSVHQRRKAERFISELKVFPFATAGFDETRDFALRFGGHAVQSVPQKPPFTCTVRDCAFVLRIKPSAVSVFNGESEPKRLLGLALLRLGIRPWGLTAVFRVHNGKLEESRIDVGQFRQGGTGRYQGPIEISYSVRTARVWPSPFPPPELHNNYLLTRPSAITGPPAEILIVHLLQSPDAPTTRAFDLRLDCLSTILCGCRNFSELAPSPWADYMTELNKPPQHGPMVGSIE